jgi:hypothetical protein
MSPGDAASGAVENPFLLAARDARFDSHFWQKSDSIRASLIRTLFVSSRGAIMFLPEQAIPTGAAVSAFSFLLD